MTNNPRHAFLHLPACFEHWDTLLEGVMPMNQREHESVFHDFTFSISPEFGKRQDSTYELTGVPEEVMNP